MPINVIVHDTRLEGRTPVSGSGTVTFEVDDSTPLSEFFDRVVSLADSHGGIDRLMLMAHGVYAVDEDTSGIMLCHEFISYGTVSEFSRLRDKVQRIVLFVCHAAETSMTAHGDGDELCRQIALLAQAEVTAAREDQAYTTSRSCSLFYCEESAIEFGEWEGPVVVFGRDGNIIAEFRNPSAWRDSSGVLHDPRIDTRPAGS